MFSKSIHTKLLIACFITLAACTDDSEEQKPVKVDTADLNKDSVFLDSSEPAFSNWQEHYKIDDISFSLDSFMLSDTVSAQLYSTTADLSPEYFDLYGKLLVYNDDSSLFIDPFSYSLIIEKDKGGKLYAREGEVDNEVAIINPKTNTRTRLLFCGPSCQVQKVFWYNDDVVCIMGLSSEYTDEYFTPMVWFVNIHNGMTIPYEYSSNVNISEAYDYLKKFVESKGIEMKY